MQEAHLQWERDALAISEVETAWSSVPFPRTLTIPVSRVQRPSASLRSAYRESCYLGSWSAFGRGRRVF